MPHCRKVRVGLAAGATLSVLVAMGAASAPAAAGATGWVATPPRATPVPGRDAEAAERLGRAVGAEGDVPAWQRHLPRLPDARAMGGRLRADHRPGRSGDQLPEPERVHRRFRAG